MTFTLLLILNIVLDVAIVGASTFVMSRPARLRPHGPSASSPVLAAHGVARERVPGADKRGTPRLRPLLD